MGRAGLRRRAIKQEGISGGFIAPQLADLSHPVAGNPLANRIARFCRFDGGLKQSTELPCAVIGDEPRPRCDSAGNRNRVGAFRFDRGDASRFIEINRGGLRAPARSVEGDHVALPPPHQKRKTIATDAGLHRLNYAEECHR